MKFKVGDRVKVLVTAAGMKRGWVTEIDSTLPWPYKVKSFDGSEILFFEDEIELEPAVPPVEDAKDLERLRAMEARFIRMAAELDNSAEIIRNILNEGKEN